MLDMKQERERLDMIKHIYGENSSKFKVASKMYEVLDFASKNDSITISKRCKCECITITFLFENDESLQTTKTHWDIDMKTKRKTKVETSKRKKEDISHLVYDYIYKSGYSLFVK